MRATSKRRVEHRSAAPIFAALGDETRLRLVTRLSNEGPLSVARLANGMHVTRQAVSKHLEVLAHAGLAHGVHRGRERIWELEKDPLLTANEFIRLVSQRWDDALTRLATLVEKEAGSTEKGG